MSFKSQPSLAASKGNFCLLFFRWKKVGRDSETKDYFSLLDSVLTLKVSISDPLAADPRP
jgi:hypothetical protein